MANSNKPAFVLLDASVSDDDIFSARKDRKDKKPSAQKDKEKPPTAPPRRSKTDNIKALRHSVEDQRSKSVFACGGKVPVVLSSSQVAQEGGESARDAVVSLPVDLRWDAVSAAKGEGEGEGEEEKEEEEEVSSKRTKLVLPLEPRTKDNLDQLLADTQPATFGRGGEDVYDEKYRKASKMDPTQFSTSFNPYTLGIIDEIAQSLLPSAVGSEHARAVRAELYKLNVSPSLLFLLLLLLLGRAPRCLKRKARLGIIIILLLL